MYAEHFNLFNEHVKPAISFSNLVLHLPLSSTPRVCLFPSTELWPFWGHSWKIKRRALALFGCQDVNITPISDSLSHSCHKVSSHTHAHTHAGTHWQSILIKIAGSSSWKVCVCADVCVCVCCRLSGNDLFAPRWQLIELSTSSHEMFARRLTTKSPLAAFACFPVFSQEEANQPPNQPAS